MQSSLHFCLVRYKQWADEGLYEVVSQNAERLSVEDATVLRRVLDHICAVDRIFQRHLQGAAHTFAAPRSKGLPNIQSLRSYAAELDDWYVGYVAALPASDLETAMSFVFTSGSPAVMTRGEMILHVCLHGTYHRGNAGILLQKNGITPNDDRLTDFLERAAR